jgi:1-acyl-sn-glycerol-3-phosphate acyltransferase
MIASLNLIWRLPILMIHVVSGLIQELVYFIVYGKHWHQNEAGRDAIQRWMKRLCQILGLKVSTSGTPKPYFGTLIVANHISWLDIIALASIRHATFMSKSEVKSWPVFGLLARASGTLFIERHNKTALVQAVDAIAELLEQGQTVVIFPEGTTSEGTDVGPFYSGLFNAALKTRCLVQPVAISYTRDQQRDDIAPYTLNDNFVIHLLRIMQQDSTHIHVDFLAKIRPHSYTRSELANTTRARIRQSLTDPVENDFAAVSELIRQL